jgi:hypothetical protein
MSVEQIFQRVTSILTAQRDIHAGRVLLFTVLDTLERLTRRDIERLCTLSTAEKAMERVRQVIPSDAAALLLPLAERGVVALKQLQDGFFMTNFPGNLSVEKAAARYAKVLRNATHGHGSDKAAQVAETSALLAQHDGNVPHDLPLIGYLYLLELLSHPEVLRSIIPKR